MRNDEKCPDCGFDPDAPVDLHKEDCRRVRDDEYEYLQFGPPWAPWPEELKE